MIVKITHSTKYEYSDSVFLEPHTLRFTPRSDFASQVVQTSLSVKPDPQGFSEYRDQDGNLAHVVWFSELNTSLEIYSQVVVQFEEFNPYDFIIYPSYCMTLPMVYPDSIRSILAPSLGEGETDPALKKFAHGLAEENQWSTLDFLNNLSKSIQNEFNYQRREFGDAIDPVITLQNKTGSCRDLVLLAMEVCRSLGLASRFVSGYYLDEELEEVPELHAWLEVYIPGAGWRGFDPTHGIACYGRHIALAVSSSPVLTACVSGSYRGQAKSAMSVNVAYENITGT